MSPTQVGWVAADVAAACYEARSHSAGPSPGEETILISYLPMEATYLSLSNADGHNCSVNTVLNVLQCNLTAMAAGTSTTLAANMMVATRGSGFTSANATTR